MDYSSAKELITVFVTDSSSTETGKLPSPSDIPEENCKKALAFILTGTQVNSNLRFEQAMEWYINALCMTSLSNDCPDEKKKVSITDVHDYRSSKSSTIDECKESACKAVGDVHPKSRACRVTWPTCILSLGRDGL